MTAQIPSFEPSEFAIGETLIWRKRFADYSPADGWALTYYFRGPTKFDASATADGDSFNITVASTVTTLALAGTYYWQAWVVKGAEKHALGEGRVSCQPGLAMVDGYDGRSQAEKILQEVDDLILRTLPGDTAEYAIGSRHKKRWTRAELIQVRSEYAVIVARERRAEKLKQGAPFFRNIHTRFVPRG